MTGSAKRGGGRSAWATRIGANSAGRKRVPRNSAAVARALPVRSKTKTDRAMIPIQSPSSLTAYEVASRKKSGLRRGSVNRGSGMSGQASYFISAQLFLQMHKFSRICATNCPDIERFHDAAHNVAGFNDYGRGREHGFPSLSTLNRPPVQRPDKTFRKGALEAPLLVFGAIRHRPA